MGRSRFLGGTNIEKDARDLRVYMAEESGVPYQVMVSDDDTTPSYLSAKIISTDASVVITVLNDGADEDLDLSVAVYVAAEIATHASDADAHHALVTLSTTANNNLLSLSGQEIGLDNQSANVVFAGPSTGGAAAPSFRALVDADIPASIARDSEVTAAVFVHTADADAHHNWPLLDADIPSTIARDSEVTAAISSHASDANAHHNRSHAITSASDHTVTGAALDVVGLTSANTLGVLTPSAAVSTAVSALLKTDSNGRLRVQGLGINAAATGDTLNVGGTGTVAKFGDGSGAAVLLIDGAAGQVRDMRYQSGGVNRWVFRVNNSAESGSDAGSNFQFIPYNDAGTAQPAAFTITRSNSAVAFSASASVASDLAVGGNIAVAGDLTIATNGNQGDRFLMENSNVSGGSVFYDFNQTDRDAGSTGAFELGFYRDTNNITEVRMSKEVFEIIIKSGGTFRFPLEVRAQQVILAELPTSNPGIVGALYRSGGTVLVST